MQSNTESTQAVVSVESAAARSASRTAAAEMVVVSVVVVVMALTLGAIMWAKHAEEKRLWQRRQERLRHMREQNDAFHALVLREQAQAAARLRERANVVVAVSPATVIDPANNRRRIFKLY
jgi:hypothetical protein